MRAFVITDASRRKAKPVGVLFWEPGAADGRGRFSLEIASRCTEQDLPLSLSFCLRRKDRRASARESLGWVRSRIVPENRQNITEVLAANGLPEYDEIDLLAACEGRSSDDDFFAYEVELPEGLAAELSSASPGKTRADKLLSGIERKRSGSRIYYAVVELPDSDSPAADGSRRNETLAPAQRIGRQIRHRRLDEGLTQKQLAARVGITQTVVSRIESGSGNPTLGLLEDIAAALDASLDVSLGK